ncbi:UNVERIFIED_CONTAM: spore germination protein YaaH [Brevibacillus sp. OAP136]
MKKLVIRITLLLLVFLLPFPIHSSAATPSITVVKIMVPKAYTFTAATVQSHVAGTLSYGEEYPIVSTVPTFYEIQILGGKQVWIGKTNVTTKMYPRIVLGWNSFGTTDDYIRQSTAAPGINVVSPRWLFLNKSTLVEGTGDIRYVKWAHASGKKVWVLLGNHFDDVLTKSLIADPKKRQTLVTLVTKKLVDLQADGINVDFENIAPEDKQAFVSFVKELASALHPYKMTVSVDVTRDNPDPYWSGSFDRAALGKVADYVIMMGYEEHWETSDSAGSVASLPWVKDGLRLLLQDVPSQKVLLGVPLFNREWVTNVSTGKVTATERTMAQVEQLIASKKLQKRWDSTLAQNYVEFTENGQKHQIWLEDRAAMVYRKQLATTNMLGGIAAWYLGEEAKDVWPVLATP